MKAGQALPSIRQLAVDLQVSVITVKRAYFELEREGVIVRPLDMFGMPDAVRITVGTPDEIDITIAALREVVPALL